MSRFSVSLETTGCCGIREAVGLHDGGSAKDMLMGICEDFFENSRQCAYIFFSSTTEYQTGEALRRLIEEKGLGEVIKMGPSLNPSSDNQLKMFTWKVDKRALKNHYNTLKPFEEGDRVRLTEEGKIRFPKFVPCRRLQVTECEVGEVEIESLGTLDDTLCLSGDDISLVEQA